MFPRSDFKTSFLHTAGYLSGWDAAGCRLAPGSNGYLFCVMKLNGVPLLPPHSHDFYVSQIPAAATEPPTDSFYNEYPATTRIPGAYSFGFWLPQRTVHFGGSPSQTEATSMSGAFGTSMHISRSKDLIIVAVNTSPANHSGGKISGAVLDQFAAAITGSPTPTPTPTRLLRQRRLLHPPHHRHPHHLDSTPTTQRQRQLQIPTHSYAGSCLLKFMTALTVNTFITWPWSP